MNFSFQKIWNLFTKLQHIFLPLIPLLFVLKFEIWFPISSVCSILFIRNWIIYRIGIDPPNVFLKCRLNFISNKASIIHLFCYTWSNKCITLCAKKVIPHLVKKDFQISFHFKHSKGLVSLSSKMIPEYFSRKISLNVFGRFVLWCNVINYECISFFQCTISTSWSYTFTIIWDFKHEYL